MALTPPGSPTAGNWTYRAIFGCFDGATSLVGVLAGLLATQAGPAVILAACLGLAVSSAVGMAAGDYLAGATRAEAFVMGLATLIGSVLPALPLVFLTGWPAYALAVALLLVLGVVIAEINPQPRRAAYTTTALTLLGASVLSAGAALIGLLI